MQNFVVPLSVGAQAAMEDNKLDCLVFFSTIAFQQGDI